MPAGRARAALACDQPRHGERRERGDRNRQRPHPRSARRGPGVGQQVQAGYHQQDPLLPPQARPRAARHGAGPATLPRRWPQPSVGSRQRPARRAGGCRGRRRNDFARASKTLLRPGTGKGACRVDAHNAVRRPAQPGLPCVSCAADRPTVRVRRTAMTATPALCANRRVLVRPGVARVRQFPVWCD